MTELGWKPFKPDSKIQPNCCAKFIVGGNHDRTLEIAFGTQNVNQDKGADNSHVQRCPEIEQWAKDVYDWCAKRYGQENIIGFQVHLDESSPHINALIVPVGQRAKSGRECVMWSTKFGKNRFEYGQILKDMHTSLYEEVGSKYGLERGDSIDGRNVKHLHKRDYIRKLTKEAKQAEKAVKELQSMMRHPESKIFNYNQQLEKADQELASGKITPDRYKAQKTDIQRLLAEYQTKLEDKAGKLHEKELELEQLTKDASKARSVVQPFRNHIVDFTPPRITEKLPVFCTDNWVERQNQHIEKSFTEVVHKIESLYRNEAAKQVAAAQQNVLADFGEIFQLRNDVKVLAENYDDLKSTFETMLDQMSNHSIRSKIFAIADALICGTLISVSSGGGGGNSFSDLRWNGRRPDEEEEAYRRRCLLNVSRVVMIPPPKKKGGLSYNIYNDLTIQIQLIINQITINFELSLLSSQLYILRI